MEFKEHLKKYLSEEEINKLIDPFLGFNTTFFKE